MNNERLRIETLHQYNILDTPPEKAFDDIVYLAALTCETSIALISLIDEERQWFKARIGLALEETPRDISFCTHAIKRPDEIMVVPDTHQDERFRNNALVTGDPHIRFYAGAPLVTYDGMALGTLCVIDTVPRELTEAQRIALNVLRRSVVRELELRRLTSNASTQRGILFDILHQLTHELDPDTILQKAVQGILQLNVWQSVGISLLCPDGQHWQTRAEDRMAPGEFGAYHSIHSGVIGRAYRSGQIQSVPDIRNDPDFFLGENVEQVGSELTIPIMFESQVLGVLNLESNRPNAFDNDDIAFARSITGIIAIALKNAQRFASLQNEINQRTLIELELARNTIELAHARDQAIEASRLKSEFLATMSHEIRTPLSAVIGVAELLLDTQLDEDQREFVGIIDESSQILLALINDILDFSKIEAGKFTLSHNPVELRELVHGTMALLASRAQEKGLIFSATVEPDVPDRFLGDAARLRQVLLNLIGNAVKFTNEGQVTVRVLLNSQEPGHMIARFQIIDTGIGLAESARTWLFNPFTQADGSHTRKYGGTGLGLAISRRLVELMDGTIGVESIENQGSTFWFTLPLEIVPETSQKDHKESRKRIKKPDYYSIPGETPKPATILLVEDNPFNQQTVRLQLERLGYTVDIAGNGTEAIELLRVGNYGIIFMDVHMPGMDGLSATRRIRILEADSGKHTPVIAMTAGALEGDRERCLSAGMDDYVSKPVNLSAISDMLRRWLAAPES